MRRVDVRGLNHPCFEQWTPRTCRAPHQRSPIDHVCREPRLFPHVCRCSTCGDQSTPTTSPRWLVLTHCPKCRADTGYRCTHHR